jgi:hypothetical protein
MFKAGRTEVQEYVNNSMVQRATLIAPYNDYLTR